MRIERRSLKRRRKKRRWKSRAPFAGVLEGVVKTKGEARIEKEPEEDTQTQDWVWDGAKTWGEELGVGCEEEHGG